MFDFADEAVGDLWIEMCLNVTSSGVIDGCFMDGCANERGDVVVPGPLKPATAAAYRANKPRWMGRLQKLVPGILICGSGGGWVSGEDGKPAVAATQVQNWGTHNQNWTGVWMPMLAAAVKAGVIFEAHAPCGSSDPDDPTTSRQNPRPLRDTELRLTCAGTGRSCLPCQWATVCSSDTSGASTAARPPSGWGRCLIETLFRA